MTTTNTKTYTIDAAGKRLGKVATEAATVLMGKNEATFAKHIMSDVVVTIENASKLDIPEKRNGKIFQRFTGWPGGRKVERLDHLAERRGIAEVVKRTVNGMLPKNKHQKPLMKQLIINE
jgi:large subunit ribosomal protein L13